MTLDEIPSDTNERTLIILRQSAKRLMRQRLLHQDKVEMIESQKKQREMRNGTFAKVVCTMELMKIHT